MSRAAQLVQTRRGVPSWNRGGSSMRKALQGFFGSWAAHAEHMRERRQVASAHGDAIAKRLADNCAHMSFLVSSI